MRPNDGPGSHLARLVPWTLALLTALIVPSEAGSATLAKAPTLLIGSPAPALREITWIKGTPVRQFEPGQVYVVEFWATWCGPCQKVMPFLSALQAKYAGRLTVIGLNVEERDKGNMVSEDLVRGFVDRKADLMSYTVAMDDSVKHPAYDLWMTNSGAVGIPMTFVIDKKGRIIWMGHPVDDRQAEFNAVVEHALKGDQPDLEAARAEQSQLNKEAVITIRYREIYGELDRLLSQKDYAEALKESDRIIAKGPKYDTRVFAKKLTALLHLDERQAFAYIDAEKNDAYLIKEGFAGSRMRLIAEASGTIAAQADLSRTAYAYAVEHLTETVKVDPNDLDDYLTLAWANHRLGNASEAIAAQRQAITLAESRTGRDKWPAAWIQSLKEKLASYEKIGD
jgi:thiol-disulfide isomerase/thioredoxin